MKDILEVVVKILYIFSRFHCISDVYSSRKTKSHLKNDVGENPGGPVPVGQRPSGQEA